MIRAAKETNANQRAQFIQSFVHLFGHQPSPERLAEFDAAQRELGFISNNFSAGFTPSSPAPGAVVAPAAPPSSGKA